MRIVGNLYYRLVLCAGPLPPRLIQPRYYLRLCFMPFSWFRSRSRSWSSAPMSRPSPFCLVRFASSGFLCFDSRYDPFKRHAMSTVPQKVTKISMHVCAHSCSHHVTRLGAHVGLNKKKRSATVIKTRESCSAILPNKLSTWSNIVPFRVSRASRRHLTGHRDPRRTR